MFRIRLIALALGIWALSGLASAQDADTGAARRADDVIARILSQSPDAPSAPPASALPVQHAPSPSGGEGPAPGSAPSGPPPVVMSARIGEHADRTRLVLELSDPITLRTFTLANPDRVVVDMPEVAWRLGAPPRPSGRGAIRSYRYGLFRQGNSRMVIDLNRPVTVADPLVIPPMAGFGYRVVIDLFPAT